MPKAFMFNEIVDSYVRNYCKTQGSFSEAQVEVLSNTLKCEILEEAALLMDEDNKKKIKREAKNYKRRQLQKLKLSLIIETIFLAFCIGIIVNQVTNLISAEHLWHAIIIFSIISVLIVIVATAAPKE